MFHMILYQPEIPPNTGNIMRLCANTGATLHLIHPLGFELDEPRLKRAGMDYRELACVVEHQNLDTCLDTLANQRVFAVSTRARTPYARVDFLPGDVFLLGPETRGLPQDLLNTFAEDRRLTIPMRPENRSLNLSNAAAILLYEAWRQQAFDGAIP